MRNESDKILNDREKRANTIAFFLEKHQVVATIRANVPGSDKRLPGAYVLIRHYSRIFAPDNQSGALFIDGEDGPTIFRFFDNVNAGDLKKEAEWLENIEEAGRLLDIDIHTKSATYHRKNLRKCLVCDDLAVNCIRAQRHDPDDILRKYQEIFDDKFTTLLQEMIDTSIMSELDLDPKFGLVTPTSKGSHSDMDYAIMLRAKDAIIPYFTKMFIVAMRTKDEKAVFPEMRKLGLEAEEAMLKATGGINAYKGLIFSLGIIIAASAMELGGSGKFDNIFVKAANLVKEISKELASGKDTYGKIAFQEYGFSGARGEAEKGFPHVREALALLDEKDIDEEKLFQILVYLIANCDDTVFLKRSKSMENYLEYKKCFRQVTDFSHESIQKLTDYCIMHNLSFGGSADLLVIVVFLDKFRKSFHFDIPADK